MKSTKSKIFYLLIFVLLFSSCEEKITPEINNKLKIVTTTTMITDLAKTIGGEDIILDGLMGAGVDPHLYKATAGDVAKLRDADIIFYNGLHLEGKLVEVFEKMNHNTNKTVALASCLDPNTLISSEDFASNYDPHIWFNINYWIQMTEFLTQKIIEKDPKNRANYINRKETYLLEIRALEKSIISDLESLDESKRILVTAHDAFNYFGQEFSFQVVGLQGLSTATEAGVKDLQKLAEFIIQNEVKSVFIESSVPRRTIEALQASVKSKGHQVTIGGTLYSDALGDKGSVEGTYIGMYKYNVNTIINSLK